MNDICTKSKGVVGREPGSLGEGARARAVDTKFVSNLTEKLKMAERLRASDVTAPSGPRPIFSTSGLSHTVPLQGFMKKEHATVYINGVPVPIERAATMLAVRPIMLGRFPPPCFSSLAHPHAAQSPLANDAGESEDDDAGEREEDDARKSEEEDCSREVVPSGDGKIADSSKPPVKLFLARCKYCGHVSSETELQQNKAIYDPHLPWHIKKSAFEKMMEQAGGIGTSLRSGRCFFCYAKFPQASLAAPSQKAISDMDLSWEYNSKSLRYRMKAIDHEEASLHYRVLLRNVGLLRNIQGKISDKVPKQISQLVLSYEAHRQLRYVWGKYTTPRK